MNDLGINLTTHRQTLFDLENLEELSDVGIELHRQGIAHRHEPVAQFIDDKIIGPQNVVKVKELVQLLNVPKKELLKI